MMDHYWHVCYLSFLIVIYLFLLTISQCYNNNYSQWATVEWNILFSAFCFIPAVPKVYRTVTQNPRCILNCDFYSPNTWERFILLLTSVIKFIMFNKCNLVIAIHECPPLPCYHALNQAFVTTPWVTVAMRKQVNNSKQEHHAVVYLSKIHTSSTRTQHIFIPVNAELLVANICWLLLVCSRENEFGGHGVVEWHDHEITQIIHTDHTHRSYTQRLHSQTHRVFSMKRRPRLLRLITVRAGLWDTGQ